MPVKFPIVDIRKDIYDNWNVVKITESITVPVSGDYITRLTEVPDDGTYGLEPVIIGLDRVNTYSPSDGQFAIKYANGNVIFNENQAGNTYSVTYYGKGSLVEAADLNYLYSVSLPLGTTTGEMSYWNDGWQLIDSTKLSFNGEHAEVNGIQFDLNYVPTIEEIGLLHWNSNDQTMCVTLTDDVMLQIGQETLVRVKNTTGQVLLSGQIVRPSGATGDNVTVSLARADNYINSRPVGVVTETIGTNQIGFVTVFGNVRGIDTSMWSEGELLYLSPFNAGELTNVKPSYPNFAQRIAVVVRSHASVGFIIVDSAYENNRHQHGAVLFGNGGGEIGEDIVNFYWDDINDRLGIGTNNPTHTLHVSGSSRFGLDNNYSEFEDDGTLTMSGSASVWKDENLGGINLTKATANQPTNIKIDNTNILTYAFDGGGSIEEAHGSFELQHDYKEGTDLWPHLHYYTTSIATGNVKWFLDYWISIPDTTIVSGTTSVVTPTNGIAWHQFLVDFDDLIDGTNLLIASQIHFRIYRDSGDVEDTYVDQVAVGTVGIHYKVDTVGSRQITTK